MSHEDFIPRRGDVITVDLDPVKGHEQGGRRLSYRQTTITGLSDSLSSSRLQ